MQLFQSAFFDAGNIGARDSEKVCRFSLCPRPLSEESVAHHNDLPLALGEDRVQHAHHLFGLHLSIKIICYRLIAADHIYVGQGIAVAVDIDGLVDGYLMAQFFLRSKIHQDLIRYPLLTALRIPTKYHRIHFQHWAG